MKILITAVGSFLGEHMARVAYRAGDDVSGTTRNGAPPEALREILSHTIAFDLQSPERVAPIQGFDAVVHFAHDFRPGMAQANMHGTQHIVDAAILGGVQRQIYVSSYSAIPTAVTEYGKSKFEIEQWCLNRGVLVVRPGLVAGSGGIFGRILSIIRSSFLIPLLDGGYGRIPIVGVNELSQAIKACTGKASPKADYNLFHRDLPTLREIVSLLCKLENKKRVFVSVPSALVISPLQVLKNMGVWLPIDIDNVRAFVHNQNTELPPNLLDLVDKEDSVEELFRQEVRRNDNVP